MYWQIKSDTKKMQDASFEEVTSPNQQANVCNHIHLSINKPFHLLKQK